jgi:hypothetical protein
MKNCFFLTAEAVVILFLLFSFVPFGYDNKVDKSDCFSMIWNQHVSKKSWIYLDQDLKKFYKKNSDLTEAEELKMPKNNWDATYTDYASKQKFGTPNAVNASFKFVTTGYKIDEQRKKLGFDFIILNKNKKSNEPYIFRIINNSQNDSKEKLGTIREVGFVFDNWPQYWEKENKWTGGEHSFSGNYQVEKLNNLIVKFKFRLVDFNAPLNKEMIKEKWLGSYATCDLRFNEYDEKGQIVNKYLIGVIFSNPLKVDYNDNIKDGVLFAIGNTRPGEQQILLLHGNKNGVKEINEISSGNTFQTVEIDFKPLIKKYLNINKNNKNIITGLDIYSATRAVDFTYEIQNIQVTGCK